MREQGQQKGEVSPFLAELQRLEEQAKQQGLGRWSKVRLKNFRVSSWPTKTCLSVIFFILCLSYNLFFLVFS